MSRLAGVAQELREIVGDLDPACVEGRDALSLVRVAAEVERLGATAKALLAQRCVRTGVWKTDRKARVPAATPAEWLSDLSGSPIGAAKDALAVSDALLECPETNAALRSGELSLSTAREATAAASVGGESAERRVLRTASREGLRGARDEARRVLATAADAAQIAARIHRNRNRRRWVTRDGTWNLHVDAPALLAGAAEGGERCQIAGLGPVPVAHARALLGESILTILVEDGRDVRTFARPGRAKTTALAQLLEARDATCIVSGCGRAARLEGDHHHPVAAGGDSDDRNLHALCRQHHRRKSSGWALRAQPDHTWTLEPPPGWTHTAAA